jgi:phage terminase small subunit
MTPKQENFCLAYLETGNASEAYRRAYDAENMKPETVNRKAFDLLENGKIGARVQQLQAEHRRAHNVTVASLTAELEEARTLAITNGQASAAVQATMGIAKLHGLLVERTEVKTTGDLSLEQVRARIKEIEDELTGLDGAAPAVPTQH